MGTFFRKKTPEEIAQQEKLDKEKPKSNAEIKAERLKELDKELGIKRDKKSKGGIARGCGKVMSNRRKVTKYF
jgi:RNase P/RNase MRP subunit p30